MRHYNYNGSGRAVVWRAACGSCQSLSRGGKTISHTTNTNKFVGACLVTLDVDVCGLVVQRLGLGVVYRRVATVWCGVSQLLSDSFIRFLVVCALARALFVFHMQQVEFNVVKR